MNPTQFNAEDGSGYDFIAGIVLALDAKNPQVAARLLSAFKSWRTMPKEKPLSSSEPRPRSRLFRCAVAQAALRSAVLPMPALPSMTSTPPRR
jgi:hypothetical protein